MRLMRRIPLAVLLPLLAGLFIATWAGGVGVAFMVLNATALGEWGPIMLGLVIVVGVVLTGAILSVPRSGPEERDSR